MLKVESLTVAYDEKPAIRDISFCLHTGEVLGLIGPNGAGKSTFIRAVSGIAGLIAGKISFDGQDVAALSATERARILAVVPQSRELPAFYTVRQTVLLGRTPYLNWLGHISPEDERCTQVAMERTNVAHLANRYIGSLSGGEQQRVLLARALSQQTPILLLDEPTTHLDLQYQLHLLALIWNLASQDRLTVIMVLHDLNLVARYADRVALLAEGKLVAFGSPEEVFVAEQLSQAYQVPLQVVHTPGDGNLMILPEDRNYYQAWTFPSQPALSRQPFCGK